MKAHAEVSLTIQAIALFILYVIDACIVCVCVCVCVCVSARAHARTCLCVHAFGSLEKALSSIFYVYVLAVYYCMYICVCAGETFVTVYIAYL